MTGFVAADGSSCRGAECVPPGTRTLTGGWPAYLSCSIPRGWPGVLPIGGPTGSRLRLAPDPRPPRRPASGGGRGSAPGRQERRRNRGPLRPRPRGRRRLENLEKVPDRGFSRFSRFVCGSTTRGKTAGAPDVRLVRMPADASRRLGRSGRPHAVATSRRAVRECHARRLRDRPARRVEPLPGGGPARAIGLGAIAPVPGPSRRSRLQVGTTVSTIGDRRVTHSASLRARLQTRDLYWTSK